MDKMTTTQMLTGIRDWVLGKLSNITSLIPSQASAQNQLADKTFVNSSIATATATFRGTYNVVTDLSLSYIATHSQIASALATKMVALSIVADNNDYAYVQIPTADATPTEIAKIEKYKYNGSAWAFEYELNNSGFTAAQWAAINSGITNTIRETMQADIAANQAKIAALQEYQSDIDQGKADRDHDAVAGHVAVFDNNGNPVDGGILTEGVYDVSEKNPTAGPNNDGKFTLEYILNQNNVNTLIPTAVRKGGMSIKFVHSSDNKYVQYRYTGTAVTGEPNPFLDTFNWLNIDGQKEIELLTDSVNIKPNTLYKLGNRRNLTVSFIAGESMVVNEYMFQFTVTGDTFSLTLPAGVRWFEEPDFNDGSTYQVSVVDNLAIIAEWEATNE